MNIRSGSLQTIFVFGPEAENNQMMRILGPDYGPHLEQGGTVHPFTNTFCDLDKYILQSGHIHLAILTNPFLN